MPRSKLRTLYASHVGAPVLFRPVPDSDMRVSAIHRKPGNLLPVLEQLFVLLLLLSSMNVITALRPSSRQQAQSRVFSADLDTSSVAIDAGFYAFGGMLALTRWRRVLRAARSVWPLLALPLLACLSTAWSVQPAVTLRRSVSLMAATWMAIYIGERFSIEEFARLLARTMCLMIVAVLALYLVAPEFVIDRSAYGGALKGLSAYKNTFGEHMAVALLLIVLIRFRHFRWSKYAFLLIAAGLLFLSRSATAVLCGVLGLAAIPMWRLARGRNQLLVFVPLLLAFSAGAYLILASPEFIFQLLGRDATLTGRTRLWGILLPVIANRPFVGYGYEAFWAGIKPEVLSVWIDAGRLVPVGDNGYLDLCLGLGLAGVSLFLFVFIGAFRKAVDYAKSQPESIGVWPITYLFIFAADNICESALLTRGTFPFLVFAILATSLALEYRHATTAVRTTDHQRFMPELNSPVF